MGDRHLYGWESHPLVTASGATVPRIDLDRDGPRISIVIPTFNQADTIEGTLVSILSQDYGNIEIIVRDGGSTDATLKVLEPYHRWISVLVSEPDHGQADAINQGFRSATGSIFAWLNSDDLYLPGALRHVASCFTSDPEVRMVIGSGDVISADQKFLKHIPARELSLATLRDFQNANYILQQSCFWSSSLWRQAGGVDESLQLLMDYDLWFRFLPHAEALVTSQSLAAMRYYPNAKTVRLKEQFPVELAYVYGRHGAHDLLRDLVSRLMREHSAIEERFNHLQRTPWLRLLKRLRLVPG